MKITKDVANNRDTEDKMFNVNKVDFYVLLIWNISIFTKYQI